LGKNASKIYAMHKSEGTGYHELFSTIQKFIFLPQLLSFTS